MSKKAKKTSSEKAIIAPDLRLNSLTIRSHFEHKLVKGENQVELVEVGSAFFSTLEGNEKASIQLNEAEIEAITRVAISAAQRIAKEASGAIFK